VSKKTKEPNISVFIKTSKSKNSTILFYYCLLLRELFSYGDVWFGQGTIPHQTTLYENCSRGRRQQYATCTFLLKNYKTDLICWISVFAKNVIFIMLHCRFCYYYYNVEFECDFLLFSLFITGDKSWQKYIQIMRENICQRYSACENRMKLV
jgi:hypothetical protein